MNENLTNQKKIMAIHDISCIGKCSLTVALPILSAAGINTGVLPTAVLSTHTGGFTGFTYRDLTDDIESISQHWSSLEIKFDALYSGFLGSFAQIDLVGDLFEKFKTDDNIILIDPVMADNGRLYSIYSKDMVAGMAKLCKYGDIIVPNVTEALFMLGYEYNEGPYEKKYIEKLLKELGKLGSKFIVITGVYFDCMTLGAACYNKNTDEINYIFSDKIDGHFHGTGDVFGSALLSGILNGFALKDAVKIAVDFTCLSIQKTIEANQNPMFGVCFERALPKFIEMLKLS